MTDWNLLMLVRRLAVVAPLLALSSAAHADRPAGVCINVGVDFTPADDLQIVAWLEDTTGAYQDTIFITRKTGRYGMGNRPGRYDFNSGPSGHDVWPYGRRITTFPVWSNRHHQGPVNGMFPMVKFQNGDENNLSHPFAQSSPEILPPYCRPMNPTEAGWDTGTCASAAFTDKGMFSTNPAEVTGYPPRADLTRKAGVDAASVDTYRTMNPFDAISQATPAGGVPSTIQWAAPQKYNTGNYVLWVEVSKEHDTNTTYNYPAPTGIPWMEYGTPYLGQPSILYKVPFTLDTVATRALTTDYAGYGDPDGSDGIDGTLRPPDATITTDTPGSGASRLQLVADGSEMFRVRVRTTPEIDQVPPDAPGTVTPTAVTGTSATLTFVEPGDDGLMGAATGYEIRVRANSDMTTDNFPDSPAAAATVTPQHAGAVQTVTLDGLLPETDYWVGIRAYDNCFNQGALSIVHVTTAAREAGTVDACFIATAAYGSLMANDVELLRGFRDRMLESNVLGELAVETYYTFGPAVAGVVGESDLLRSTARGVLAPIVTWVRHLAFRG